jgi:hypothetical protein
MGAVPARLMGTEMATATTTKRDATATTLTTKTEGMWRVRHAAEVLDVPESWVYAHAADLGGVRVGRYIRFAPATVRAYLLARSI